MLNVLPDTHLSYLVLSSISHSITCQLKVVIFMLCSALGQPQLGASQYKKNIKLLDSVQSRSTGRLKGLETKLCDECLRALGLFSQEKRRPRGDLISVTTS